MRNHFYENEFDLHEYETSCTTHFHLKGFALRLVLKQAQDNIKTKIPRFYYSGFPKETPELKFRLLFFVQPQFAIL